MAANEMPDGFSIDRDREAGAALYHGPVTMTTQGSDGSIWLLEITGAEEGDVLHTAADWMNSRRFAVIMGLNWLNDVPGEPEADDPRRVLRMTVDMSGYQDNFPPR
jgi:hypothetical protein